MPLFPLNDSVSSEYTLDWTSWMPDKFLTVLKLRWLQFTLPSLSWFPTVVCKSARPCCHSNLRQPKFQFVFRFVSMPFSVPWRVQTPHLSHTTGIIITSSFSTLLRYLVTGSLLYCYFFCSFQSKDLYWCWLNCHTFTLSSLVLTSTEIQAYSEIIRRVRTVPLSGLLGLTFVVP